MMIKKKQARLLSLLFYCSKIRQKFESNAKIQYNKNVRKYRKL